MILKPLTTERNSRRKAQHRPRLPRHRVADMWADMLCPRVGYGDLQEQHCVEQVSPCEGKEGSRGCRKTFQKVSEGEEGK